MLPQNKLSKLFLIISLLVWANYAFAETKWEVAIVFRGEENSSVTDEQFQKDIDNNILELARINPKANLKVGIYRELLGKSYSYLPAGSSKKSISLSDLLYGQELKAMTVPGTLIKNKTADLKGFLKNFYKDSSSKKALIIYSHGLGPVGLSGLTTKDLKLTLGSIPHLDLLWLDACFMANIEFLYELRSVSDFTISSEEAEFSAGLPFQVLSDLPKFATAKEAAIAMAKNFIESYSFLKNGKQRFVVSSSSATVTIVENKKIAQLANSLKWVASIFKKLSAEDKVKLNKILIRKSSMDDSSLIDLGLFLIELRKLIPASSTDTKLTSLIRMLNIESIKKLKTNLRIHITPPEVDSTMVYGFNNWKSGSKKEFEGNDIFASIYKNDAFIEGPNNKFWPLKDKLTNEIIITPFAPGINVFNYYFLDKKGKLITEALSVTRTHDIVESLADSDSTQLLYTAYTQAIGSTAERYTGLNISLPGSVPSLDYFELEFNQLAQWLSL